jgi:hypothetical protein
MAVPVRRERTGHEGVLSLRVLVALTLLLAGACSSDPVYLAAVPPALDWAPVTDPDAGTPPPLLLSVPMALPTADDDKERMAVATRVGFAVKDVPTVRRDDTDLELEWSLANPGTMDAHAKLAVNGANELFLYDPALVPVGRNEDRPPPLMGGRPITVPAGQTVTGVFREDELAEAAQDLDAFSRGGVNLTRTLITRWPTLDVTGGMGGALDHIPSAAIPLLLRLTIAVDADRPLRLAATLRVRDRTGRLRPIETNAAALVAPSTTAYIPPPMMMVPQ